MKENISEEENNDLLRKKKKRNLHREVMKMQGELEDEQALNKALRDMLRGPVMSQPRLSLLLLPPQAILYISIYKLSDLNKMKMLIKLDYEFV